MNNQEDSESPCTRPLESVIRLLGRQWTISLILLLGKWHESIRYSVIRDELTEESNDVISDSTLSRKLSELTNLGIVTRKSYDEIPPRVEYSLTNTGITLYDILNQIADWTREQCHNGMLNITKRKALTNK